MRSRTSVFACLATFIALAGAASVPNNETHTFKFTNRCGNGTQPALMIGGKPVSLDGDSYTAKQPVGDFRAFLGNGKCGPKGENCPFVEGDLVNPPQQSHATIFVLPNATNNFHPLSYRFGGGGNCNGTSQTCDGPKCLTAAHIGLPPDNHPEKNCTGENAGIEVRFCAEK